MQGNEGVAGLSHSSVCATALEARLVSIRSHGDFVHQRYLAQAEDIHPSTTPSPYELRMCRLRISEATHGICQAALGGVLARDRIDPATSPRLAMSGVHQR